MESTGVPKFASFKPKPKKNVEPTDELSVRDTARHRSGKDDQGRSHDRHAHQERVREHQEPQGSRGLTRGHQGREKRRRNSEDRQKSHRNRSPGQPPRSYTQSTHRASAARHVISNDTEESTVFLIDRRGDQKNVEYGSLHRYDVPPYRRTGYGNVMGLNNQVKIDRETRNDRHVCLVHVRREINAKAPRLLASKHGPSRESHYRFIVSQDDGHNNDNDLGNDYIDLQPSRKRRRSEMLEQTGVDYRSVEGKAKAHLKDDDLESDVDEFDHAQDLAARQHNALLSKRANTDPKSIDSWLALIEHQAQLVQPGKDESAFTSSERRTVADLRLSMIEEALGHISKGAAGHERLLLIKIVEGSHIWTMSKRNAQWEEALKMCPSSILLWTKYLDHVQDHSHNFRFEACRDAFLKCLAMLADVARSAHPGDLAAISEAQIYVLLRYTSFARDSGYSELSIAIWQALLEWSFYMPVALKDATFEKRMASFEQYWDSECPRVGEQHAHGWVEFYVSGAADIRKSENDSVSSPTSKAFDAVVAREAESSQILCLPTAADADAAVEDPFRCVLFSDIREVLPTCDALTYSGQVLLRAMLQFLGLPPMPSAMDAPIDSISWYRDPHLAHAAHNTGSTDMEFTQLPLRSRCETIEELLHDSFPTSFSLVEFIDHMLEQILAVHFEDGLAEYIVAYKHHYFRKLAPKAAKEMLKKHPSSLRLYNGYALVLATLSEGREMQKPLQIWSTAVHMRVNLPAEEQDNVVFLWHSRLLCLARYTSDGRAPLASLMTICETSGDVNTKHLKVQRELESGFDRMQLVGKYIHASLYADLLAWLAHLTSPTPIESAFSTYNKFAALLSDAGDTLGLEHLLQHKAKLVCLHISQKHPFQPALLRNELEADLARFPSNSDLLALRDRLSNQDRLRELAKPTRSLTAGQENIIQWSFRLTAELRRMSDLAASGATKNNIRARFVNAAVFPDSSIKHAPALWMLWLTWEHSLITEKSATGKMSGVDAWRRTKQVYLDGLRHIPWHKEFLLRGLQMFTSCTVEDRAGVVEEMELRQWWDVLLERGLRVRYEIE